MRAALEKLRDGDQRAWAVVLLAAALAISDADLSTIGAVAGELEAHLHINDVAVGALATGTAVVGALATVPVGALTDRLPRVRMLIVSVLLWTGAMVVSALSVSYEMLLISRLALGLVTATSGPTLASLTGDLFPARERGNAYGRIESGELAGAGLGLVGGGVIAGLLSWRASFLALGLPALLLAWGLWRKLPEPPRGSKRPLYAGGEATAIGDQVAQQGVEPDRQLVLRADPARLRLRDAVRYVLSIPTNRMLIVASALGYFYFTGVQTFAVVLLEQRFGLGQTAASGIIGLVAVGAVLGVLAGGQLADRRITRGHISARVSVAGGFYLIAVALLALALVNHTLPLATGLFFFGAGAVTAANPPLDAARLDVVPSRMWGRAEGVRTLLRQAATALAPVSFGLLAAGLGSNGSGIGGALSGNSSGNLDATFLVLLVTLLAAGMILLRGRHRLPHDVATAGESQAPAGTRRARTR